MNPAPFFTVFWLFVLLLSGCTNLKNPCPDPFITYEDKKIEKLRLSNKKSKKNDHHSNYLVIKKSLKEDQIALYSKLTEASTVAQEDEPMSGLYAAVQPDYKPVIPLTGASATFDHIFKSNPVKMLPATQLIQTEPDQKVKGKRSKKFGFMGAIMMFFARYLPLIGSAGLALALICLLLGSAFLITAVILVRKEQLANPDQAKMTKEELKAKRKAENTVFKIIFWILLSFIAMLILITLIIQWWLSQWW